MDEYIKRQDAIDELMEMVKTHSGDQFGGVLLHYTGIKAMLECIEPANVRPVVGGTWEWNEDNGYYYCSQCGSASPREDQNGEYCDCPRYCHNCGSYNGGDAE